MKRPSKKTFWFEYEWGFGRSTALVVELLYNALCYFLICLLIRAFGVHLVVWPFFPLYIIGFNVVSLIRVALRKRGFPPAT